jgi:hypothetical protein
MASYFQVDLKPFAKESEESKLPLSLRSIRLIPLLHALNFKFHFNSNFGPENVKSWPKAKRDAFHLQPCDSLITFNNTVSSTTTLSYCGFRDCYWVKSILIPRILSLDIKGKLCCAQWHVVCKEQL